MLLKRIQKNPFLNKIIWTDQLKFSQETIFNRCSGHFQARKNGHVAKVTGFQEKFSNNEFCLLMNNKMRYAIYHEKLHSWKYLEFLKYQLYGVPAHCTTVGSAERNRLFNDRGLRRFGSWNRPPRSPDITPLEYYLSGIFSDKINNSPVNIR